MSVPCVWSAPPEERLDMECDCGARASSEWTWTEWATDTMCGQCYEEERAYGAGILEGGGEASDAE